jgi:ABC-type phosphate/phosphonate transport system substrate-binding protein
MEARRKLLTRRECVATLAATAATALAPPYTFSQSERNILLVAISIETLAGANVNDARAAYRVWLREVASAYGKRTAETVSEIFIPSEEIIRSVRRNAIDCYGGTALEFAKLVEFTDPDSLVLQDDLADGVEYVFIVHNGSRFRTLSDLSGANIASHHHRNMVLLPAWLDTTLSDHNLPALEKFFASHRLSENLTQVVLPVFFRRLDGACLTRRSWETALELNPQLGRDLRLLLVSPRIIPITFGFHRNTSPESRQALIDSIRRISSFTAGRQIVALYQSTEFVVRPISVMKGTLEMVRRYERLSAQHAKAGKGRS